MYVCVVVCVCVCVVGFCLVFVSVWGVMFLLFLSLSSQSRQ